MAVGLAVADATDRDDLGAMQSLDPQRTAAASAEDAAAVDGIRATTELLRDCRVVFPASP